jgi:dTDP-4-dehydrorhamnose 3,5-epimerase
MKFIETKLSGCFLIEVERREDERGFFARGYCQREMNAHGLTGRMVQVNTAVTYRRGTVRGLHYQVAPAAETKLVRCLRGGIYDLVVDIRPESPTYLEHLGVELTAENRLQLLVSEGFAHGYQTLTDDVEILYLVSEFYSASDERGIRPDDPHLGIEWPLPMALLSEKDRSWPPIESARMEVKIAKPPQAVAPPSIL